MEFKKNFKYFTEFKKKQKKAKNCLKKVLRKNELFCLKMDSIRESVKILNLAC